MSLRQQNRANKTQFFKDVQCEFIRLGGLRGPIVRVLIPLGAILPIAITLAIAAVASQIHSSSGESGALQVRAVSTENSIYWLLFLGVSIQSVVAAHAQASSQRGSTGELAYQLLPSRASTIAGRWFVLATISGLCCFVACVFLLVALPAFFPDVYGQVSASSPAGIRFLWAAPLYSVFSCAVGVGLGAWISNPSAAVVLLLLWTLFAENAVIYIPQGASLSAWMPFLNGIYGTGQQITLSPAWGPNFSLLYFAVFGTVLLLSAMLWSRKR